MRKLLVLAVLAALTVALAAVAVVSAHPLDTADVGTEGNSAIGHKLAGWSPVYCSGQTGGSYGGIATDVNSPDNKCRLVWWSDDDDPTATLTLESGGTFGQSIELRALDGIADDSFNVYVKNPAGKWALVYSYPDAGSAETWVTHTIDDFPAGKGQGTTVEIMIEATGAKWTGFDTWGQLAVDYIKLMH